MTDPTDRAEPMKGLADYLRMEAAALSVVRDPRNVRSVETLLGWAAEVEAAQRPAPAQAVTDDLQVMRDAFCARSSGYGRGLRDEGTPGENAAAQEAFRNFVKGYRAALVQASPAQPSDGVPSGDGAERRVEAFVEKRKAEIRRCPLGCLEYGQCKANMHGVPSLCPARSSAGTAGVREDGNG